MGNHFDHDKRSMETIANLRSIGKPPEALQRGTTNGLAAYREDALREIRDPGEVSHEHGMSHYG